MADMAIAVRTSANDRVEQVGRGVALRDGRRPPVLDCGGADAAGRFGHLLAGAARLGTRALRRAALLLAARALRRLDARVCRLFAGPSTQLDGMQAARAVRYRPDDVRVRARQPRADVDDGDPHVRGDQRGPRHLPVRHPPLRRPPPARSGNARPLHDLLGSADARHRRRARARAVRPSRTHMGRARDAGARRRRRAHVHAERPLSAPVRPRRSCSRSRISDCSRPSRSSRRSSSSSPRAR